MIEVVDDFTHECLAIRVFRKLEATDDIDVLADLKILRGVPPHIQSDNGPEFIASPCRPGSVGSVPGSLISRQARHGRTAMLSPSTQACETNF
jgi:hypothetical protein